MWRNYYTGEELDLGFGVSGSLKGGTSENCAILVPRWNGWTDWGCLQSKVGSGKIVCACEHPEQMYLLLRGLCPDSNIDQFYVPRNKPRSGKVNLLGFTNTVIEYEGEMLGWKLRIKGIFENTTARSKAPLSSYVLGTHEWLIEGDNAACSTMGEAYTRVLKLTGCREGEFTCSDGQCIRGQKLIYQTSF